MRALPAALLLLGLAHLSAAEPGETHILKWKDGKKAAFTLGFDDSAPSQLKNAIPELEKRKIVGTFYLVTGNKLYESLKPKWEAAAKSPFVVIANHTFTHQGASTAEELDPELAKCNEVLYALHPERKQPYLLAFGKPGGVPWKVTDAEVHAALEKHHLINRPPFAGPPLSYKSIEQTLAVVDKALAKGDLGYLVFHGVGGDWLATPMDWFTAILDKLEQHRADLWLTDSASAAKYAKERDTAAVKVIESTPERIRLALTSSTDPALYDQPLTVSTQIPASWKTCHVLQGRTKSEALIAEGGARYEAVPGEGDITLTP